jgi:Zn-dependent peptidase ImmA (M78 family)
MKIPTKIKLGSNLYQIKIHEIGTDHGLFCDESKLIELSPTNQSKNDMFFTLIHEITHGLLHEYGYRNIRKEEKFVRELEKNIKRFFIPKATAHRQQR